MIWLAQVCAVSVGGTVLSHPGLGESTRASCDWSMMSCRKVSRARKKLVLMMKLLEAIGVALPLVQVAQGSYDLRLKSLPLLLLAGATASPSPVSVVFGTQVPPGHLPAVAP